MHRTPNMNVFTGLETHFRTVQPCQFTYSLFGMYLLQFGHVSHLWIHVPNHSCVCDAAVACAHVRVVSCKQTYDGQQFTHMWNYLPASRVADLEFLMSDLVLFCISKMTDLSGIWHFLAFLFLLIYIFFLNWRWLPWQPECACRAL